MNNETKKRRVQKAAEVINKKQGLKISINEWLTLINEELDPQLYFRNTKQLGQLFRSLKNTVEGELVKTREVTCDAEDRFKMKTIYYQLLPRLENG